MAARRQEVLGFWRPGFGIRWVHILRCIYSDDGLREFENGGTSGVSVSCPWPLGHCGLGRNVRGFKFGLGVFGNFSNWA